MEAKWISSAINVLGLTEDNILELPINKSERIRESAQSIFLDTPDSQWWWEHLLNQPWVKEIEDAWKYLPAICPREKVWFIPLEDHGPSVYESTPTVISRVLGESPAFEYALVGKNFDWILIENHHNCIIATGHVVKDKLTAMFGS